ncbi:MFS transporter (macronuclear) [Tetrahymena thermophila SB210]|uniref:Lysosomal dipeptide transporter MFSD1 n=1 Tax=Tetrahymena thermophila (strain SB210) TaxID=312017 RepID=I7LT31_TETTS|nr:MFS transporter [Tetrahymena thermophila SB210]EAR84148.2 MFS transporter [Tetrahymena thermophila SB210]|eukprot:XP_001031811.2 MFS transporter [Tetrahymena thermophila SB210]
MIKKQENVNDSTVSDLSDQDTIITPLQDSGQTHKNGFCEKKRMIMLPSTSILQFGSYFSINFQSFVKEQLMDSMHLSNNDYSLFVLIPNLPCIPLPLMIGPILDSIGARLGTLVFSFLLSVGLALCMISIFQESFVWLVIGKTIFAIANAGLGVSHGCIAGKWFTSKGLGVAFTLSSFFCKIASSSSGILFPQLYDINNNLMAPLSLGLAFCLICLVLSVVIFVVDKNAEKQQNLQLQEGQVIEKYKFKFSDLKKFGVVFWMFVIQCPLMFGAFYAFENYLQSVLIHKFMIEKTLAGELVSIPYWIAYTTPLFGFVADKFGLRIIFFVLTSLLSFVSVFILWILPTGENDVIVYISLVIFGLFLSAMCAYLYPSFPLLSEKELLSTAFALGVSSKNAGLAIFNYVSNLILGSKSEGYNNFLLFYLIIFLVSLIISCFIYFYDRKHGSILNSATPQRYVEYLAEKRNKINESCYSEEEDKLTS